MTLRQLLDSLRDQTEKHGLFLDDLMDLPLETCDGLDFLRVEYCNTLGRKSIVISDGL